MKYKVIAPFRDSRSGDLVQPGDTLPKRLDEAAIGRLVRARCVAPLKTEQTTPPPPKKTVSKTPTSKEAGGGAPGLFPGGSGSPVAGGDRGADSQRTEPDGGSGPGGESGDGGRESDQDDSGQ